MVPGKSNDSPPKDLKKSSNLGPKHKVFPVRADTYSRRDA